MGGGAGEKRLQPQHSPKRIAPRLPHQIRQIKDDSRLGYLPALDPVELARAQKCKAARGQNATKRRLKRAHIMGHSSDPCTALRVPIGPADEYFVTPVNLPQSGAQWSGEPVIDRLETLQAFNGIRDFKAALGMQNRRAPLPRRWFLVAQDGV